METDFFDVLANPYRREIIRLLRWKDMGVNEITEALAISQPSVSRHLDIMKKAEIILKFLIGLKVAKDCGAGIFMRLLNFIV